jgi:hypothetical protein
MACNLLHKLPKFYVKDGKTYDTKTNKEVKKNMKTAMKELVDFLDELNSDKTKDPNLDRLLLQKWCQTVLLEKENQQITNAYDSGNNLDNNWMPEGSYYKETFKQQ